MCTVLLPPGVYPIAVKYIVYPIAVKYIISYREGVWGDGGIAPPILMPTLDGGEWSPSHHGHFNAGERAPGVH